MSQVITKLKRTQVGGQGGAGTKAAAEAKLRDIAFVLHMTERVKASMIADKATAVRS